MPRVGRIVLPNYPHHVIHRGHNRSRLFSSEADFKRYLGNLEQFKEEYGCLIYSFCLMTNHVHLIVNPGENAEGLSMLMKRVAGRYTGYLNAGSDRSGTAWNGRFKSNPIQTDRYLLTCCRYVDLNPVRAGLVQHPGDYRWSSFNDRVGACRLDWLDEDPIYRELGSTRQLRETRYAEFVLDPDTNKDNSHIREAINSGFPLGNDSFLHHAEDTLGIRIIRRQKGRPRLQFPAKE